MQIKKNWIFFSVLTILVVGLQFIFSAKHLEYGFNNDDWYVLAWYKQVVSDPIGDILKAWKAIGPHNFAHAYYIGPLFEIFGFNYPYYHIFNTILKVIANLSIFPLIYLLFRSRVFAFLTTILFAIHFTPFGGMNNVLIGEDSLMLASINLFLATYVWASQKRLLNSPKILILLFVFLLASAAFDITRSYPFIMALPFVELVNLLVNRSSTTLKALIFRLIFLYSPFIAVVAYSPQTALNELSINKIIAIFKTGNYQLFIGLFASFGSTFMPSGMIEFLSLFGRMGNNILYADLGVFFKYLISRYLIVVLPALVFIGSITVEKPKGFIIRSLFLCIMFSFLAFFASNYWMHLDPKVQAGVDPGVYLVLGLIGLFVFATSISFFIEWLKNRRLYFLLTLSLTSFFALLYTFLTWMLVDNNAIFTGVHGYLSVAAIGSSIYLSILLYLAFQKTVSKQYRLTKKLSAAFVIIYFFLFAIGSYQQVDNFYAYWLLSGFSGKEQERIHNSFWEEVGFKKPVDNNPTLIYIDGSQDYVNGYFYSNAFVWDIPSMLTVRRGEQFDSNGYCKTVVNKTDKEKLRIETRVGKKVIIQTTCGDERAYLLENFYAFKMINRNVVPIKEEVLKELGGQ